LLSSKVDLFPCCDENRLLCVSTLTHDSCFHSHGNTFVFDFQLYGKLSVKISYKLFSRFVCLDFDLGRFRPRLVVVFLSRL